MFKYQGFARRIWKFREHPLAMLKSITIFRYKKQANLTNKNQRNIKQIKTSTKKMGKAEKCEDFENPYHLHRYFNIFMILMVIMISAAITVIYLNQESVKEFTIIFCMPKISLACAISFTILLWCFIVDDSSTFIFMAVFTCIAFAVMNAFAGATMFGIFNREVIFEFSSEIWYKSEMSRNMNGATLILMNMMVQLVYACYLAPTFSYYMKDILTQKENDELWRLKGEALRGDDDHYSPRNSGRFYDHFAEDKRRETLRRTFNESLMKEPLRFLRIFGSLPNEKKTMEMSPKNKKKRAFFNV